jgi:hypothetical protein
VHITRGNYGCGGAGRSICGVERPRDQFVKFLVDTEGLKASHELMNLWLDESTPYVMRHDHILIGPLKPDQYDCLRTVTFWVNPDQLAVLCQAAMYYTKPGDPTPVIASFGSGCMELAPIFPDLDVPQAMIGSTDIAMRDYVRPDELAFSVTRPMFELLCRWADDPRSSLHKGFLKELVKARGGKL